ncbi:pyridoxamine 5'-phosphate oxidase family protein [Saccharopolyspora sp. K220]|uniref:pyridoxamine 5'-phosphate oxidase family protein n=1 Tax=Saccharopolyspora soli TaxID=2926618 RepID=UPI001F5A5459|nr:pyridoxamine 5'-phosphate oxidase family protein [Saccharopolyspora soli]MCI2422507.1 pyridoxamine 5'-phosphate oxidase family protein [Saccharopolyspora soli]
MIHLVYRFRPTAKARADLDAFWRWIADRQLWFYDELDMVVDTKWWTVTIGEDVHCLEHHVSFADEAAWGRYRSEIHARSSNPDWEARRTGQDDWWDILDSQIRSDPPIPLPLPVSAAPSAPTADSETQTATLVKRSRHLVDNAHFLTLATQGSGGPWASTVNYVALPGPLRLLWYSNRHARHSVNLTEQPRVSASMFLTGLSGSHAPSGIPLDGAQLTGVAREVPAGELAFFYDRYYELNFPDPEERLRWRLPQDEFRDDGPRRFYILTVDRWWLLDADRWATDKHDARIEVPVDRVDR